MCFDALYFTEMLQIIISNCLFIDGYPEGTPCDEGTPGDEGTSVMRAHPVMTGNPVMR